MCNDFQHDVLGSHLLFVRVLVCSESLQGMYWVITTCFVSFCAFWINELHTSEEREHEQEIHREFCSAVTVHKLQVQLMCMFDITIWTRWGCRTKDERFESTLASLLALDFIIHLRPIKHPVTDLAPTVQAVTVSPGSTFTCWQVHTVKTCNNLVLLWSYYSPSSTEARESWESPPHNISWWFPEYGISMR